MDDDLIIRSAREILAQLPAIVGTEDADRLRPELASLLDRTADGGSVVDDLLALLAGDPRTRGALAGLLPVADDPRGTSIGLPGLPDPADTQVFRCATCGYEWPVFEDGEPVPECPNGHGRLQGA